MKNLTQFKNRIQVGVRIKGTSHMAFVGRSHDNSPIFGDKDLGIREVSIKQSNAFALKTTRNDGSIVDSWCDYPKASRCRFNGPDSITIIEEQENGEIKPVLTYEFINN